MARDITVPDLGDFKDVEVIDVLVKPGDKIDVDTPLITLETEKATLDVPSTSAGVVKSVAIKKGDRVSKGSVIAQVEGEAKAEAKAPAEKKETRKESKKEADSGSRTADSKKEEASATASEPTANRQPPTASFPVIDEVGFSRAYASPSVRKFARELGVDLTRVKGTGPKGRITPDDVKAWVKQTLTATSAVQGGALPKVPEVD
ncbi:MAG: biotin/lipoyl-containing protein, partial [Steroidobacteraceae bacterium]